MVTLHKVYNLSTFDELWAVSQSLACVTSAGLFFPLSQHECYAVAWQGNLGLSDPCS